MLYIYIVNKIVAVKQKDAYYEKNISPTDSCTLNVNYCLLHNMFN